MLEKFKILLSISFFIIFCSCSTIQAHSIKDPPTRDFVKILHRIDIVSCADPKDAKCPIGARFSSGSGLNISMIPGLATVLTAGHVCDVGPTEKIKEYHQTVEVMDYESNVHQAYPTLISHNDQKGAPDACLLFVPTLTTKGAHISYVAPRIGEDLYYIGAPMGIYHPPNPLIFKGVFSGDINGSTSQITAPAIGGSSGSAVLNMDNKVVGIVWGTNLHFHNSSVMSNYVSFRKFLEEARQRLLILSIKKF